MPTPKRSPRGSAPWWSWPPRCAGAPPLQDRSPAVLCHQVKPGACLVRGTFLRTADRRSQPAYISLAGRQPMPRRRVVPTKGPAHHRRAGPASTTYRHHGRGAQVDAFTL